MRKFLVGFSMIILLGLEYHAAYGQAKPESVVANLYKTEKAKGIAEMSETELRKYFDKKLANAIWKAARDEKGLGFNMLYNANTPLLRNFKIGKAVKEARTSATVTVSFTNFRIKERFEFAFCNYAKGWRINEIIYTDGTMLSEILKW